ncbi:Uncharacterized protein LOCC1_G007386 [Lachnellula occidentalis]|uniref:FAD-binding domain-containing protein n=1 Tax=Lachnellula occidentalis TaxID=215460 RepID=A0A8H8RV61_9HELO|nr:Uncharacterized protein LOCC1_G007386 [Lachnellula occidentalis]
MNHPLGRNVLRTITRLTSLGDNRAYSQLYTETSITPSSLPSRPTNTSQSKTKILITGAGIAGTSLAFWLSKLGHDIIVVKRFPSLRATGLQIDLCGHGIEVMKRMGLEEAFRSKSAPEEGLEIVDKTGRRRAFFPANRSGKGEQSFTTDWEIMRGDLCRLVYEAGKERVKYVFGMWVEGVEDRDGGVEVKFSDGRLEIFDLVVGADGVGSHTRKMMFGSAATNAFHPLGGGKMYVGYLTTPRPIQEGDQYIATIVAGPRPKPRASEEAKG